LEFDFIVVGAGSAGAGGKDSNPWIHVPVGYFKTMGNPKTDWCYKTEADPGLNGRSIPWPRGKVLGGSSSINGLLYVRGQAEDFEGWRQMGNAGWGWDDVLPYFVGYFQLTAKKGQRCSSAVAYLKPIRGRSNLKIFTNSQAEKLILEGKRITGVTIRQGGTKGKLIDLKANKEVVLSSGAIGSPQLLMVSGIGPKDQLKNNGIEIVKELKGVGQNLQDHLQARPVYKVNVSTINVEIGNFIKQGMIGLQYILARTGPMTMAASLGTGFLKTREDLATPDIQFHIQPWSADSPAEGPHKFSAFTSSVLQMRPESAGHLELTSSDMRNYPKIHPNYLATKLDCDTMVEGLRISHKITQHGPLKTIITGQHNPNEDLDFEDYDAVLDWARSNSTTIYHPTGTCKMGSDTMAVVDERLKVRGLDGIRVADCSIMPIITSGNTNAPAIMIGEKCAAMMLEDAA